MAEKFNIVHILLIIIGIYILYILLNTDEHYTQAVFTQLASNDPVYFLEPTDVNPEKNLWDNQNVI